MKIKIKNYDYEPISMRIRAARKNKKFTQEYIAEKLNVSCQHISDIERGLSGLSVPMLMELCKILEVDADYILFGMASKSSSNPINHILSKLTPQQAMYAEEIVIYPFLKYLLIISQHFYFTKNNYS